MSQPQSLTLSEYNRRVSQVVMGNPGLQNVWVTAETADVQIKGGHCYLELVEKDPATGRQLARMRATIWASAVYTLLSKFTQQSGQEFRSDLKVMVLVNAGYHPLYGLSVNIVDINGAYTLGDVMQRRNQMIQQLQREGIIDMNRQLHWPVMPHRIAVISAKGAAGYGDFINQLYNNRQRIRFTTGLFTAVLQGERTAPTIINALDRICDELERWDCVVIIRGGGASTDLLAFDNYELASHIAQFPLPVIIGIGHERDITLLDYVANMRVKTPTAAAEWLINRGDRLLGWLQSKAGAILQAVTDRMGGCHRQLSTIEGQLPAAAQAALQRARARLDQHRLAMASISDRRLRPEHMRLDNMLSNLRGAIDVALARQRSRLDADSQLLEVLSPQATLARGYSITRVGGHAVTDPADLRQGEIIETILAKGTIYSTTVNTTSE